MSESRFEELKGSVSLQAYAESHLQPAAKGHEFVCPSCQSGGHGTAASTSAFCIDPRTGNSWHCFSCNQGGDIFDLAAIVEQIDPEDKVAQYRAVAQWAGLPTASIGHKAPQQAPGVAQAPVKPPKSMEQLTPAMKAAQEAQRAYIEESRQHITDQAVVNYLTSRGYTIEEAQSLGMGYDPATCRLILPYPGSTYYHIDRDITGTASAKYTKPAAAQVGKEPIYNAPALNQPGAFVFIVEGPMDAAAVNLAGHEAVALGGTGYRSLLEALETIPADRRAIPLLMLDRDEAGRSAQERLAQDLAARHIVYEQADENIWIGKSKDADERRKEDPDGFSYDLKTQLRLAAQNIVKAQNKAREEALKSLSLKEPESVAEMIYTGTELPTLVPTGIQAIDRAIGGGLPERGLTVLGAPSSMGKTTLLVQMADQMAKDGREVLFVTVEQSAQELVAKSLARYQSQMGPYWKTAQAILNADERGQWGTESYQNLYTSTETYLKDIGTRLHYLEAVDPPSVEAVKTTAQTIKSNSGQGALSPVIFIDYLQLLSAPPIATNDKQATDQNISALRRLARDLKSPVVVISSLNRNSYSGSIKFESFKESGAIEYGADLLLGLQPQGLAKAAMKAKDDKEERRETIRLTVGVKANTERKVELVVLKNRNGKTIDEGIPLTFNAAKSLFF